MNSALCLILFCSFSSAASVTGHWESVSESNSFVLDLVQSGEHVSGNYCFITNNGNRIDCAESDDEDNITGSIKHGVAVIEFESTFGGEGRATAIVNDKELIYTIKDMSPFIQANMSVPDEIKLTKNTIT